MSATDISSVLNGALFGALIAIVFNATSLAYYNGFARIPSKLTLINSAHSIVELTLIAALINLFP